MAKLIHAAVAVIESPYSFIVEDRPDWPGELAYAGKLGLYGGHVERGELPRAALGRELVQELGKGMLRYLKTPPSFRFGGIIFGEDRNGVPALVNVNLFHVPVASSEDLVMQVPGEMFEMPKTVSAIEANLSRLTPFAAIAMTSVMSGSDISNPNLLAALL